MLGLKYYSYQYYSYQDLEQLKEILKYDSIGEIRFYEEEKIIEYKINRQKCFLLSDLIELIKIEFIRFHLGQLLLLFIKLLEKVQYIVNHKIEHQYLSLDRIWLKFNNNQYLTIIYKQIEYEIAFTGYKNIFYENLEKKECADSVNIVNIISDIINYFIKNNIVCNKKCSKKNVIIENIYQVILKSCQKQDIQDTIDTIKSLLKNHQFDPQYQTIQFDDKVIDHYQFSKRKYHLEKIEKTLQQFVSKYDQNPIILELFLFEKIYQMREKLKNWTSLDIDENQEQIKYSTLIKNYDEKKQQSQNDVHLMLSNLLDGQLKTLLEPFYKFEMDQSLKQNLFDQIKEFKILKYFENSRKIFSQIKFEYYLKVIIDYAIPYITDYVIGYIRLQILVIINELI